jgi:hypothetical protein
MQAMSDDDGVTHSPITSMESLYNTTLEDLANV